MNPAISPVQSVYIALGSNQHRDYALQYGIDALRQIAHPNTPVTISPVYESPAVGFKGPSFYNCVVSLHTSLTVDELERRLKAIEQEAGRSPEQISFTDRILDLDMLLYGDAIIREIINGTPIQVPRIDITQYAFVLKPLCDIAGDNLHPERQQSYHSLWQGMDKNLPLVEVALETSPQSLAQKFSQSIINERITHS